MDASPCCLHSVANVFDTLWRHFLPINHFCHLISILLLMFVRIIFDNSLINVAIKDCIGQNNSDASCILNVFLNLSSSLVDKMPVDQDLTYVIWNECLAYKFELISYGLACVTIYIRYGAVYWFTNKSLSFLITFIGFIGSAEQLFQIYGFIFLFKGISRAETSTVSVVSANLLIRNKLTLLFLYFTLSMLVYLSATPAYVLTFLKYRERFLIEEALFVRTFRNRRVSAKLSAIVENEREVKQDQIIMSTCCFNYCPHLIATIQLILMCACKMPFCYDYIMYYNKENSHLGLMLVIITEIMHTIVLIFIWLLLTLKSDWTMHLQTAFSICHWTYHLR